MLGCDAGAKRLFELNRGQVCLPEPRPVIVGAAPRTERLHDARFQFRVRGSEVEPVGFIQNHLLSNQIIEHLRAELRMRFTNAVAARSALSLRYLLAEIRERVFILFESNFVAPHFDDSSI